MRRSRKGSTRSGFRVKSDVLEGFVTRESDDEIEFRDITGTATVLKKRDVKSRGKRDTSMMPTALADALLPQDLASLIAYLESLKTK